MAIEPTTAATQPVSFLQAALISLRAFNCDFLLANRTYLTGGAAVAMQFGVFRQTRGINLVCASRAGFVALRNEVSKNSLGSLFCPDQQISHSFLGAYDHAEFSGVIQLQTNYVTFANVRYRVLFEPRIDLEGEVHPAYKVPVLSRNHLFVAKLLSNADRSLLPRVSLIDIVDLAVMIADEGQIPPQAWQIACQVDARVKSAFLSAAQHASVDDHRLAITIGQCLARKDLASLQMVREALAHQIAILSK